MSSTITNAPARSSQRVIATQPESSRAWWFLGTLAVLRNPQGAPRTPAVIELTVPPGSSPPRHVHDTLDDSFFVLDGEIVVRCGDETFVARAGAYVVLPAGVDHTFRVTSSRPARMLLVHADDSFLQFIEAVGTPTTDLRLPPDGEFDMDPQTLTRVIAEHDARVVGASLDEEEARRYVDTAAHDSALGGINHVALKVTDLARSERWYIDAFGLVRIDGHIAEDGTGHVTLLSPTGGWVLALASSAAAVFEHVAFTCSDRDHLLRWHRALADRGVTPGTITDAPYGSGFVVRDPDGLDIELFTSA